jgi:hypothetical protein
MVAPKRGAVAATSETSEEDKVLEEKEMAVMRVIYRGTDKWPEIEPVFEENGVVDATIRRGGTKATPENSASATNGVGARSGADA